MVLEATALPDVLLQQSLSGNVQFSQEMKYRKRGRECTLKKIIMMVNEISIRTVK